MMHIAYLTCSLTIFLISFVFVMGQPAHALEGSKLKRSETLFSYKAAEGLINEANDIIRKKGSVDDATKLIKGAVALLEVDPMPATFFDGRITVEYDTSLFALKQYGWFGDWGIDPLLPAPTVEAQSEDTHWLLQTEHNPGMSVSSVVTHPLPGTNIASLQVEFDWGPDGHIGMSDTHFNFFGVVFDVIDDTTFGVFESSVILPQNDFFAVSNVDVDQLSQSEIDQLVDSLPNYNRCLPADSDKVTICGVSSVPEPSTLPLLGIGVLGLGLLRNRLQRKE